ncbi:glycosyltransferase [Patescibacteria group bacterium]
MSKIIYNRKNLPFVSFIIPTLNSEKYLNNCLSSIQKQTYPKEKYEVLVIDGGSVDNTRNIANKFSAKIIDNPFIDPETAKSLGIQNSKGGIIALLDSDNEIVKKEWLEKMVKPLQENSEIFGVESQYFFKKGDSIFNKYCMLAHIADPFSRCLASKLEVQKKGEYMEYFIKGKETYPLGSNGFLWNKKIIKKVGNYKPKFEESNFSYFILGKGFRKFARVPGYGIYHYHISSLNDFIQKRLKIGNKFLNRKDEHKKTWLEGVSKIKFICCGIYCATFVGPLLEGLYNLFLTKQKAWLLHPIMSFLSVFTYGIVLLRRTIKFKK